MILCDLCGQSKKCQQKEIEGKEFDICSECWNPLAEKLKGRGRKTQREMVFLPPVTPEPRREERNPVPEEPPKIWAA